MPPITPTPKLTHFLCLPLITSTSRPQLKKSISEFRQAITNKSTDENPDGIPLKAIRPVGTLHLTLGVMSLSTSESLKKAKTCLQSPDTKSLVEAFHKSKKVDGGGGEVTPTDGTLDAPCITLRGLKSMHGQDPAATSVLYAPPEDSDGSFQMFCQSIRDEFIKEGLIVMADRPLIVHATIVNTVYVPAVKSGSKSGHGRRSRFVVDARVLLDEWADFVWMKDVKLDRVAICRMGARKVEGDEDDEEYIEECTLTLP